MRLTFIETPVFRASARGVVDDADLDDLQERLLHDPRAGPVIVGTGGARKVRLGVGARGKRAGVRVVYYFHARSARMYLLLAYPKNAASDLSPAGRRAMKQLIAAIERES